MGAITTGYEQQMIESSDKKIRSGRPFGMSISATILNSLSLTSLIPTRVWNREESLIFGDTVICNLDSKQVAAR